MTSDDKICAQRRLSLERHLGHHGGGLTLIELMVAIALLAILSLLAHRGLDSMSRANVHSLSQSERWQAVTLLFERFSADVSQPARRPVRNAAGIMLPAWWGTPAAEDAPFEWSRKSPSGQDEVRLGYRLREGTIELLLWPELDRAPGSLPQAYPLLEHVSDFRVRHLDAAGNWQERWPISEQEVLPRAVAIEITLAEGAILKRVFALP